MLKLRWSDVDLFARTISIRAFNTKTLQARAVHMTERLHRELVRLAGESPAPDERVFGIATNVKGRSLQCVAKRVSTVCGFTT